MFKNNPGKTQLWQRLLGREGSAISHTSQSPGRRLLGIFPTRTQISTTHFVRASEPGGKRSRFPRLRTPFSHGATKPNTSNQNLSPPLFPAPDKELVSCPAPERQQPLAYFCRRVTQPLPADLAVAQPRTLERREKLSPYFLTDRFALRSYFYVLCLLGCWGFSFNVLSCFASYLTQAKGQRGKFCFSSASPALGDGASRGSPRPCVLHCAFY